MDTSRQIQMGSPKTVSRWAHPAAAAEHRVEATDCRRDLGAGRVSSACSADTRHQREPGIWLAPATWQTTWGPEAGDQVAGGSGEREFAGAFAGGAQFRRFFETTAGHDSHRTRSHRCASKAAPIRVGAGVAGVPASMIGLPANTRIWIAASVTDLRRG